LTGFSPWLDALYCISYSELKLGKCCLDMFSCPVLCYTVEFEEFD
jgi:hypothetical protein